MRERERGGGRKGGREKEREREKLLLGLKKHGKVL
jgi:hypothetical protein